MYRRCLLCLILLPTLAVRPLHSQAPANSPAPPASNVVATVKASVQRVLVDIVVTNDKGEAVPDLKQKDFEVLEDGKPQTIATFEQHHGAAPNQIVLPPMPPHVYTNFPVTQSADAVNVLLLDALNTPTRDQTFVHAQMIKYLKTIPPGTRAAVFTLASRLRMLQGVTTDSSELLAALNRTDAGTHASPLLASEAESDADQRRVDFLMENDQGPPPNTLAQAGVDPVNAAKQFLADSAAFMTEARVSLTLEAMQQIARYLATVPGRKNIVWFSGSFPVSIFPDPDLPNEFSIQRNFDDEIRKTSDLLAAAQIALYPIAAEGLASDSVFEANNREISEKRPSLAARDQVKELHDRSTTRDSNHLVMEELAKDTGGHAYYNTNGLSDALARVINNGTRYYTITYIPANTAMDGKFRHIQVKLENAKANGKYTLAYRRGYYADDLHTALSAGQKPDSDPLLPLMGRNLPDYTQILYKILVQPSSPQPADDAPLIGSNPDLKKPFTRYGVDFAIAVNDLKLDPASDGGRHGSIEIALIAYDREGKPLNFVVTTGNVVLHPNVYASTQKGGLQIHKEIDVPREYVFLRTGVYDLLSNTAGTLGVPLIDAAAPVAK